MLRILSQFAEFLKEYKIIALAVAFVMGIASTALVKSLVDNLIMPIITPLIPGGEWKTSTFSIGPIKVGWGAFLGELINFIIIAFVVFLIAKALVREKKEVKEVKKA